MKVEPFPPILQDVQTEAQKEASLNYKIAAETAKMKAEGSGSDEYQLDAARLADFTDELASLQNPNDVTASANYQSALLALETQQNLSPSVTANDPCPEDLADEHWQPISG